MIDFENSEPTLTKFNPKAIPWQFDVVKFIRKTANYNLGPHEILLSGSIGSAKSTLMAHIGVTHCLMYPKAILLLGRRAMPHLKDTIYAEILNHISDDLVEGKDYWTNTTKGRVDFANGAKILSLSWADKNYRKFRSYPFSAALIEELTENDSEEFTDFHTEMIGRIGRRNKKYHGVNENFVIYATNPDDPSHAVYDYFIKGAKKYPTRHVYYSLTKQNPFLPPWYISSLEDKYDAKTIRRLLYGEWLYIDTDSIYHQYSNEKHFILNNTKPNYYEPVRITFDFNIGKGKPMSSTLFQYNHRNGKFTFIDEVVVEGTRTMDQMDEYQARGYFDLPYNPPIIIHGDASGRHNDTRSVKTDYSIIEEYLSNYTRKDGASLEYDISVPQGNPPIRTRHNILNGQLKNAKGIINIEIDKRCVTIDEGLTKSKLIKGGKYLEDDSKAYQHITTAIGYAVYDIIENGIEIEPITLR